jgi:hypothetical protein
VKRIDYEGVHKRWLAAKKKGLTLLQFWHRTPEYNAGMCYDTLKTRVYRHPHRAKPMGRRPFRHDDVVSDLMLYSLVDKEFQKRGFLRRAYCTACELLRNDEHRRAYTHRVSYSTIRDTYVFIRDHLRK